MSKLDVSKLSFVTGTITKSDKGPYPYLDMLKNGLGLMGLNYSPTSKFIGINTASPTSTWEVGFTPLSTKIGESASVGTRPLGRMFVRNRMVYICNDSQTLHIIDFKNPAAPITVGTIAGVGSRTVVVRDNYAYGISGIADISNPAAPTLLASYSLNVFDIQISGNLMIGTNQQYISVLDISNPASPVILVNSSAIHTAGAGIEATTALSLTGRYLYAPAVNGVSVIDFVNPASPTVITTLSLPTVASNAATAVVNNYAFVATGTTLYTIDVSNPAVPALVNTFTLPFDSSGSGGEMRIHNNTLYYISSSFNRVAAIDITNPLVPVSKGYIALSNATSSRKFFVEGDYIYTSDRNTFKVSAYKLGGIKTFGLDADVIKAGAITTSGNIISDATIGARDISAFRGHISGTLGVGNTLHVGGINSVAATAKVQIDSTTQGFLPPRMTTAQKTAIANTAGLIVFDTTLGKLCINSGSGWQTVTVV
jgi:hypothetical protein